MWQVSGTEHDSVPPSGVEAPLGGSASSRKKAERRYSEIIVVELLLPFNIISIDGEVDLQGPRFVV